MSVKNELRRLHDDLKWRKLSPVWAKVEIMLGLTGFVGGGLIAQAPGMIGGVNTAGIALGGSVLAVLGGYLTLAGHRSHLYQSNSILAAYVILRCQRPAPSTTPDGAVATPDD